MLFRFLTLAIPDICFSLFYSIRLAFSNTTGKVTIGQTLPLSICGPMSLISGMTTLWLPEMLNKNLTETIHGGETFRNYATSIKNLNYLIVFWSRGATDSFHLIQDYIYHIVK